MTYTRKQCKEDMIKLWGELARTGSFTKSEINLTLGDSFKKYIFKMPFVCPCCHLVNHLCNDENCDKCPIDWGVVPLYGIATCIRGKSPYSKWESAYTKKDRQYYANKILILSHMIRI